MAEYTPPSGPNAPQSGAGSPPTSPPPGNWGAPAVPSDVTGKKIAAGICGILLGALGIHKFILGYAGAGVVMLLVSILSLGLASPVMGLIGLIEGIIYLTKSDADFYRIYIQGKRSWF